MGRLDEGTIREVGRHRWHWQGTKEGRAWEAWASVDVGARTIAFDEEPENPAAKRHEGGGARYTLGQFRRGSAKGWHQMYPGLYRLVSAVVDRHFPEK